MTLESEHQAVILVVDDKDENLKYLGTLFLGLGYVVSYATDGVEAMAAARRHTPDLVITDILMPNMDGFSLCMDWVRDPKLCTVPLVFYTATYTDERDRRFGLSLGAAAFLIKPTEPEELTRVVKKLLDEPHLPRIPVSSGWEEWVLRRHNDALARKLEKKVGELQATGKALAVEAGRRGVGPSGEDPFLALLRQAQDAIFVVREGWLLFGNPAGALLLGLAPEADLKAFEPGFFGFGTAAVSGLVEREWTRADGTKVRVELSEAPCRFDGQDAVLVIARDLARRRTD